MSNLHQSVVDQVRARIGTVLREKWRIDAVLGIGGMATVYAATHRTGNRVAIKMLHPALSINDAIRKRFAQEGYVANTVDHPGVARVLDDDVTEDGAAFLVMELLEGETAGARADRLGGKLPVNEVAFLGESVASVLAAAHAKGIIHRDVKPDNIFITNEGRVVVLDFGIARVKDSSGMSMSATRTGTMMGTPAFMPPEQARGRANEMDATSDVWALGATLFWLVSGRVVHEGETPNEQLVAAATLPAPPLQRVNPEVPTPFSNVIDRALEFSKENRFPDARALEHALREAVLTISWGPGSHPGLVGSVTERPPPPPPQTQVRDVVVPRDAPITRGPTIGPVELAPPPGRATRYVRAALLGAVIGITLLAAAAVVGRKASIHSASGTASPLPDKPSATASVVIAPAASSSSTEVEPAVSASTEELAPVASSSAAPRSSAAPAHTHHSTRQTWLDRRK